MAYDPVAVESQIKDIANATTLGWGGAINSKRRSAGAITHARKQATYQVLRAIASNPKHPRYGALATLVDVEHNEFLPKHDGETGIPIIVPFAGASGREGIPADPDEIDAYRGDAVGTPLFTGALDGVAVPHNEATATGWASPVACRYSIVNARLKFTGESAQVPLIVIDADMLDHDVLEGYEGAIARLSVPQIVKEGDNLLIYARECAADGKQDLIEIAGGAMRVRPFHQPSIVAAQKQAI